MTNIGENYTITQDGSTYFISTEIVNNQIKLICKEKNAPVTNTFVGLFSFSKLRNNCKEFRECSNIEEALKLINNSIRQKRLIIRKDLNNIDLQLSILNNKISPNFGLPSYNNNYQNQEIIQNNQMNIYYPKKGKKREYLSLYLSPKEKNNYNYNSPLRNSKNANNYQNLNNSPLSTYNTTSNSSPFNSPTINDIQIPTSNQSFDEMKKLNDLENENNILKNQISNLNQQINDLNLKNQQYINDLQNMKAQSDSLLNQLQEAENLKAINEQLMKENNDLKNQLMEKNNSDTDFVTGDILKAQNELEFLTQKIVKDNKILNLNLIYKATVDGDKAVDFHSKCDQAENSLVLVETDKNARFGGFTSCSWSGNCEEKFDENAFVFSLNKFKIYDIIPGSKAIACYPNCGPVFLGCQIRIYDDAFTNGGSTFKKGLNYNTEEDFELTGGEEHFNVKDIEIYSIELK